MRPGWRSAPARAGALVFAAFFVKGLLWLAVLGAAWWRAAA